MFGICTKYTLSFYHTQGWCVLDFEGHGSVLGTLIVSQFDSVKAKDYNNTSKYNFR